MNARDDAKNTPLHYAVSHFLALGERFRPPPPEPDFDVLKLLLAKGANARLKNASQQTPLHIAVQIREKENLIPIVNLLLDGDVDVDAQDYEGRSALHMAILYHDDALAFDVARALLAKGGTANVRDRNLQTPLHLAAAKKDPRLARLLLDSGAAIDAAERRGMTPLHVAAREGNPEVVALLLQRGANLTAKAKNSENRDEDTPLHIAAMRPGNEKVAQLLIAQGADVNEGSWTPLHLASRIGNDSMVRFLLTTGKANIDSRDISGQTPLLWTAMRRQRKTAALLLENGANVNAANRSGTTPLACIAWSYSEDKAFAKLLLKNSAEVNTQDRYGWSLLHRATKRGHKNIVGLLLSHGADVNSRTKKGETPLALADDKDTAEILRQHGGKE